MLGVWCGSGRARQPQRAATNSCSMAGCLGGSRAGSPMRKQGQAEAAGRQDSNCTTSTAGTAGWQGLQVCAHLQDALAQRRLNRLLAAVLVVLEGDADAAGRRRWGGRWRPVGRQEARTLSATRPSGAMAAKWRCKCPLAPHGCARLRPVHNSPGCAAKHDQKKWPPGWRRAGRRRRVVASIAAAALNPGLGRPSRALTSLPTPRARPRRRAGMLGAAARPPCRRRPLLRLLWRSGPLLLRRPGRWQRLAAGQRVAPPLGTGLAA